MEPTVGMMIKVEYINIGSTSYETYEVTGKSTVDGKIRLLNTGNGSIKVMAKRQFELLYTAGKLWEIK